MLEKIITRKCIMVTIEVAEGKNNWGKASKEEFLNVVKMALEKRYISNEECLDLTKRAMAI